jgi:hypothetical protein
MRHLPVLAIAGLLAGSAAANAQYQRPYADRSYHRDDYNRGRGELFGRVRADLDHAEADSHWNVGDRHRFAKVREELDEFQRSGSPHELNDAISALRKVVNDNRLAYRDRDILAEDLYQMRDFRSHNGWR